MSWVGMPDGAEMGEIRSHRARERRKQYVHSEVSSDSAAGLAACRLGRAEEAHRLEREVVRAC